ncbi:MAG: M43 family zinc metalloprotease [Bacteroidia bacterium]
MKHLLLTTASLGLFLTTSVAQNSQKVQPCNTYAAMEEAFALIPGAKENYEKEQAKLEKAYQIYQDNFYSHKTSAPPVYTVPVVFHILHEGGAENIPDADVISCLDYVNKDFARTNTDANQTNPPFDASYINSEIVFKLAAKDPNGNCTNGIVRHITDKTDWKQASPLTNYVYTWDPTKYLNIYIVKNIVPTSTVTGGGIIVGYTYKPGTWPTGAAQDAIVYRYNYMTGGDNPRSMTHEIGHWLNLSHTWGNTNNPGVACGDDGVTDTPVTKGEFTGCPTTSASACTQTSAPMNGLNNVQNIMNYSGCPKNFTTGQTNKMRTALAASTSGRDNLWSAGNLSFTGVNAPSPCAPIAEFMSTSAGGYTVCSGQTIIAFKDFSYNGAVTSWSWSATNNATITSPTSSVTNIYFPTVGTASVTLVVTNGQGSDTQTREVYVMDGTPTATMGPFESFEGSGVPPGWSVINPNGIGWVQTSNAALHGQFSFMLDGSISTSLAEDILVMPMMDFVANPNATLRFSYAYRRKSATHDDVFRVQLSKDCGGSWKDVYAPSASQLASGSGGVGTSNFIPTAGEWKIQDVSGHPNWFSFTGSSSVLARFYFQEANGGFGNKIYIDSVMLVAAPVGVNELTKHLRLQVYPNPTNAQADVQFVLSNDADVKLSVYDYTGKVVVPEKSYRLTPGEHTLPVNADGKLSKGIYIINLEYNGTKLARKLSIN